MSVEVDDIRAFVTDMGVNIVSCFETKPRKRRSDVIPDDGTQFVFDRKAFRLCIASDDQHLLLDDSQWPAYVSVSEWFFKPQASSQPMKPSRSSSSNNTQLPQAVAVQHADDSDMEVTVIVSNPSDSLISNTNITNNGV